MIFMILTVFSLFVLAGMSIAAFVQLCMTRRAIEKAAAEQAEAARSLAGHTGKLMRQIADNETVDTGSDIQKELEKIMSYTGVDHGQ